MSEIVAKIYLDYFDSVQSKIVESYNNNKNPYRCHLGEVFQNGTLLEAFQYFWPTEE